MKKKYTVSTYSGDFRLEKLTSDEMEGYIRESQKPMTDYSETFEIFDTKKEAKARLEKLKENCSIEELPSNKLMVVSWVEAREWEVDEDDELETTTDQWREYYYPGNKSNPEDDHLKVCQKIRRARESAGLKQADIAAAIGTSQAQIAKYENGDQDMTITRFLEICGAIDVDPAEIVKK